MNKKIPLLLAIMTGISNIAKSKNLSLTEILTKYCVPSSESDCANRATYNSTKNICECSLDNQFYNPTKRSCESCIYGSFAKEDFSGCEPITCPQGFERFLIDGECPAGYYLTTISENENCGTGFELQSYNTATKTFE